MARYSGLGSVCSTWSMPWGAVKVMADRVMSTEAGTARRVSPLEPAGLPMARMTAAQQETLRTIFSFAEWALRQPDNHIRNAAGVSFYEHVFDGPPRYWPAIVAERKAAMKSETDRTAVIACKLQRLRAIGPGGSWLCAAELFAWRKFNNGRQLGALVGLSPTPYQSGTLRHELGISKAGNAHVRSVLVELAWQWVRYQPESALTIWWRRHSGGRRGGQRNKSIVALARKLLIALWKYVEFDELPEGAVLKA